MLNGSCFCPRVLFGHSLRLSLAGFTRFHCFLLQGFPPNKKKMGCKEKSTKTNQTLLDSKTYNPTKNIFLPKKTSLHVLQASPQPHPFLQASAKVALRAVSSTKRRNEAKSSTRRAERFWKNREKRQGQGARGVFEK